MFSYDDLFFMFVINFIGRNLLHSIGQECPVAAISLIHSVQSSITHLRNFRPLVKDSGHYEQVTTTCTQSLY